MKTATMSLLRRPVQRAIAQAVERRALQTMAPVTTPMGGMDSLLPTPQRIKGPSPTTFPSPFPSAPRTVKETVERPTKKNATPMVLLESNLFAKLEGHSVGGSIKDRAAMQITLGMLESGKLKDGDTLAVATSGNAGRSLLHVSKKLKEQGITVHIKIFMPERYLSRHVPSLIAGMPGVVVTRGDAEATSSYTLPHKEGEVSQHLHGLDGEFMDVQGKLVLLAKEHGWAILDQHYDINSLHAHQSTAQEIMQQLPHVTDVVCSTGTGGTASGLKRYLPPHVKVHARPAMPGVMDGITDVRRYANFCDVELLEGYSDGFFDLRESIDHVEELQAVHNITAGQSSGAAYALAKDIARNNPEAKVAFICADGSR